jgi:hypothetical protein
MIHPCSAQERIVRLGCGKLARLETSINLMIDSFAEKEAILFAIWSRTGNFAIWCLRVKAAASARKTRRCDCQMAVTVDGRHLSRFDLPVP